MRAGLGAGRVSSSLEGTSKTLRLAGESEGGVFDGDFLGMDFSFFGSAGARLGDLDA